MTCDVDYVTRVAFVCQRTERGSESERLTERESLSVCVCAVYHVNNSLSSLLFLQTPSLLKRAGTDKLREVFQKYASLQKDGEHYMTSEDFVRKFLGLFVDTAFNDVSWAISIAVWCHTQTTARITGSLQGYSQSPPYTRHCDKQSTPTATTVTTVT